MSTADAIVLAAWIAAGAEVVKVAGVLTIVGLVFHIWRRS